jgi:hypothetical protein
MHATGDQHRLEGCAKGGLCRALTGWPGELRLEGLRKTNNSG